MCENQPLSQLQLTPGVSVSRIISPLDLLSNLKTLASQYKLPINEKNPKSDPNINCHSNRNTDSLCFTNFFEELRKFEGDIRYIMKMKKRNATLVEPEIASLLFGENYLAYLEAEKFDQTSELNAELEIFKFFL
ncbi:5995_t:CDS:1 [Ambispora leptoticha]|uniref:5995_t:CDS:1 n=1 Tax=Ambispora leptoticha TaxID=144679 RepID=A0A9N9FM40_9GLOM|nr:5995_t:CDS:1 [Ambispora leptoticha]